MVDRKIDANKKSNRTTKNIVHATVRYKFEHYSFNEHL